MVVLGDVSSTTNLQWPKKSPNQWNFMEISINPFVAEGGRGILFPCFGVLFRSKHDNLSEYFDQGAS